MIPTLTEHDVLRLLQASPEQNAAFHTVMRTLGTANGDGSGGEVRVVWG